MNTKKKRIISLFICAVIIATAFLSILFIEKETNHECTGADCPICASIHQAEQTLRQIGSGISDTPDVIPVARDFTILLSVCVWYIPDASPVNRKVRLNN